MLADNGDIPRKQMSAEASTIAVTSDLGSYVRERKTELPAESLGYLSSQDSKTYSDAVSATACLSTPKRVRSRRKRVALALTDWNQIPAYLKDNE